MGEKHARTIALFGTALLATAAVLACGSSEEEASGEGSAASSDGKSFYTSKIHGAIAATCQDCHRSGKSGAPVFLGASADSSYTAIEGFPGLISLPSLSPILQKGIHSGPALSQAQTDLVTEWLTLETRTRKLGSDPGTPKNLRSAFKAFGACMDYNRWKELKLHTMALTQAEGNRGQCRSCHNTGQASLWLAGGSDEPQDEDENATTFLKMQSYPYVQRLVVGRVTKDGSFEGIEPSRRIIDKGTEAQQLQANSHPRFSLSSDLTTALSTFVLETISNVNANRCATASLPDAGSYDAAGITPITK